MRFSMPQMTTRGMGKPGVDWPMLWSSDQSHRARPAFLVGVERGFPDGDSAVAQRPHFDAAALHPLAAGAVFPPAFPVIGDHVAHQRAEFLFETVVLLPLHAAAKQLFERRLAGKHRQV